ncbi:hypothetical protein C0Q70_14217 [Pomacea canaliculata]|uniref:Alpha/beta hydrolase fold-3 domain-containing protein n=1 Tax=Pomacea canaliculata TaxID=400727 RepID=A0A2T7NZF2_POMCA|nr:hypothetical protein C0Q70_14217 [Pomacea canaliculata]
MGDLEAWGQVASRYTIHQETLTYFRRLKGLGFKRAEEQTPEELRAFSLRRSELFGGHVDFCGSEIEYFASSLNSQIRVPVTVYKSFDVSQVPAILVFFHGGGLVSSSRCAYATTFKKLAKCARCLVVGVEYRLAPEDRVPAAFHDCRCATEWILGNKELVGGHPDSKIAIYPFTDLTLSAPSYSEFVDTPGLNTNTIKWFMKQFLENEDQVTDPVVSPYFRPSFIGLPPALVILAELDPIRDDGLAYAKKMQEAGVPTDILVVHGAPHVFFHLPGHFKELCREPYEKIVEFVQRFQT